MRRPVLIAVCALLAASGCGGADEPAAPLRGVLRAGLRTRAWWVTRA